MAELHQTLHDSRPSRDHLRSNVRVGPLRLDHVLELVETAQTGIAGHVHALPSESDQPRHANGVFDPHDLRDARQILVDLVDHVAIVGDLADQPELNGIVVSEVIDAVDVRALELEHQDVGLLLLHILDEGLNDRHRDVGAHLSRKREDVHLRRRQPKGKRRARIVSTGVSTGRGDRHAGRHADERGREGEGERERTELGNLHGVNSCF